MKRLATALTLLCILSPALVAQEHHHPPAAKANPVFDRMKTLVGTWETTVNGQKVRTVYALAANGSALMENLMPESANMINMIHPDGDAAMLTHYCSTASQPRMRATKVEGDSIVFAFLDGTNLGDSYMGGLKVTITDQDHLVQEWKNLKGGKEETWRFEFTRVK